MLWSGSFVTRGSGAVGDVVASHNRGGQYLRERVIPTDPATTLQVAVRDAMSLVSARYSNTITDDQRSAWLTYARGSPKVNALGASIMLTSQQQYCRTNVLRELLGLSLIDNAPIFFGYGEPPVLSDFAAKYSAGLDQSTWNVSTNQTPVGGRYVAWLGEGRSQGTSYYRGPFKMGATWTVQSIAGSVGPQVWAVGQKVWMYVRRIGDDGRVSFRAFAGPTTVIAN